MLKFRSSIKPELKRRMLFRGTFIAGAGVLVVTLGGAFLPVETLSTWGLPIFLGGIVLIAAGLLPYRRLCKLEEAPHQITVTEVHTMILSNNGKEVLTVPLSEIRELSYVEKATRYGIRMEVNGLSDPVFLPYFTFRTLQELKQILNS